MKSASPLAQCTYSPSTNHTWWTPRDAGPDESKKPIERGVSGLAMSNNSTPAGCRPTVAVW